MGSVPRSPFLFTPKGCDELAKILDRNVTTLGLNGRTFSESWLPDHVDLTEGQKTPGAASYYAFVSRERKCPKIETIRIWHASGIFGELSLQTVEAIACGMPVEEAKLLPGKSVGSDFWDKLPAKIRSAPWEVQAATAIAIIKSLGAIVESLKSEGARDSAAGPRQPQPSTYPMFFKSHEDAQKRLGALFRMWHPGQAPAEITKYYADTLGIDLVSVDRIEKLLKGETLFSESEYAVFCSAALDLRTEDGDRLTSEDLRWLCQTAWGNAATTDNIPDCGTNSSAPADYQDSVDSN